MLDQAISELKRGNADGAEALFLQVLEQQPHQPLALIMAARLARQRGAFGNAEDLLKRAGDIVGDHPQFLAERGYLALAMERDSAAINWFQQLTSIQPDFADAHFNLGQAYKNAGRTDAAIASFQRALELGIARPEEVHAELGSTLTAARREREAESEFVNALEQRPGYPKALYGLGVVNAAFGQFDDALSLFREAMAGDPDFVEVYQQLADCKKFDSPEDDDIVAMSKRIADEDCSEYTREKLHFALGKAYDDCGAYDEAFGHFHAANMMKAARTASYDRAGHRQLVDDIKEVFDDEFFARDDLRGDPSNRPVFIFGMPRSGTTLLEQILASHSEVEAGGELAFFEHTSRFTLAPYPQSLQTTSSPDLQLLADAYLEEIDGVSKDLRVTNKFPANFFHVGLIAKVFPNAAMIHSARSALDTCLSIYFQDFPQANRYATKLDDIAHYYQLYQEIIAHWIEVLPGRIYTVDYEKLTAEPEAQISSLLDNCELPFDEACLEPDQRAGVVSTLSRWQVRQPFYRSSVERWRSYEQHIETLIDALGD